MTLSRVRAIPLLLTLSSATFAQKYLISTFAGGPVLPPTAVRAVSETILHPDSLAADKTGNLFISSSALHAVFRMDLAGTLTRIAGTGEPGFSGDGGPAIAAKLNAPGGIAVAASGVLYIADTQNNRVRMVDTDGVITTIAGNGRSSLGGGLSNPVAVSVSLNQPLAVAVDETTGRVFVLETMGGVRNQRYIWSVTPGGNITSVWGSCSSNYISWGGFATDSSGALYTQNGDTGVIFKGTPQACPKGVAGGDNGSAGQAAIGGVRALAIDASGALYLAVGNRVRKLNTAGTITTVAGDDKDIGSYAGDGGPGTLAKLSSPSAMAFGADGKVYIADTGNHRVRSVSADGTITSEIGGVAAAQGYAAFATLGVPGSIARDAAGNFYVTEGDQNRVRKIGPDGAITLFAGDGELGFSGDGGPAVQAKFWSPGGIAADSAGNVYVCDTYNDRVRKISKDGMITTVAGNGKWDSKAPEDGGPATSAPIGSPNAIAIDASNNLYIAAGDRIRKIDSKGVITTFAGGGSSTADGVPATTAWLNGPNGLFFDSKRNMVFSSRQGLSRINSEGILTSINVGGPNNRLVGPYGVAVDATGNIFTSESYRYTIRKISPDGTLTTVAGNGTAGNTGDGGPGLEARVGNINAFTVDPDGRLYLADADYNTVRLLTPEAVRPVLRIAVSHSGEWAPGGNGGAWTITVSNAQLAGATSGTVTVPVMSGAGVELISLSGSGWTCSAATCTRDDSLTPGMSYPALNVRVKLNAGAGSQVTARVLACGGGGPCTGAADLSPIGAAAQVAAPFITSVVDAAAYRASISQGTWMSVMGNNLAGGTLSWSDKDFVNGALPTSLGGVTVTVDGKPAYIAYVSPGQINALVPKTDSIGAVKVVVTNQQASSTAFPVEMRAVSPALFAFSPMNGRYPAAQVVAPDGKTDYLAPAGLLGPTVATRAARPGDVIVLYGTGFGPTDPSSEPGTVSPAARLAGYVQASIGERSAKVLYVGQIAPGLNQINLEVPSVPAGDQRVFISLSTTGYASGAGSPQYVYIPVTW